MLLSVLLIIIITYIFFGVTKLRLQISQTQSVRNENTRSSNCTSMGVKLVTNTQVDYEVETNMFVADQQQGLKLDQGETFKVWFGCNSL